MAEGFRLGELAARVGGRVVGDPGLLLRGVATLARAAPDELSFFTHSRYREAAEQTRAGAVLVRTGTRLAERTLLEVPEPQLALARILALYHVPPERRVGVSPRAEVGQAVELGADVWIGPFAVVEDGVRLGPRVSIGAGCFVGRDCWIDEDTTLMPRVVLYPGTRIGRRCLLHSGAVLGADGFGFATSAGCHHKVPQLGRVVVEDDVEIGANTTIDRPMLDETLVGAGSKIDDLVMVAHGVRLGSGCLLAAQTGIAGSSHLGPGVTLAGQAGVIGHLRLGAGTVVGAKAAVFEDIEGPAFVAGIPAIDHRRWKRAQALFQRLPELRQELRELRRQLETLERRTGS